MNKLYIVRHGQTDWNVQKLLQGKTDIELNKEGIKQAKELTKVIDLDKIDICICSPLKRTRKTAELIVGDKVPIVYDELVLERGFGNYEGKPIIFDLIAKQWDYKINDREEGIDLHFYMLEISQLKKVPKGILNPQSPRQINLCCLETKTYQEKLK